MGDLFGHRISHLRFSITDQRHRRRHPFMTGELQTWRPTVEMPTCREILRTVRTETPLAAGFRQVKLNRMLRKNGHDGAVASGSANPDDDDDNGESANSLPALLDFARN